MRKFCWYTAATYVAWILIGIVFGVCVALFVAGLVGCSPAPQVVEPPKVTITVKNDTDAIFYGVVSGGLVFKQVEVQPHGTSSFWAYKSMVPDTITISVTPKPAPRRK